MISECLKLGGVGIGSLALRGVKHVHRIAHLSPFSLVLRVGSLIFQGE